MAKSTAEEAHKVLYLKASEVIQYIYSKISDNSLTILPFPEALIDNTIICTTKIDAIASHVSLSSQTLQVTAEEKIE